MARDSLNQSAKTGFDEEHTISVDMKGEGYGLGAQPMATVAEKHRGTPTDQHDMQVLGRIQELRVWHIISSPPW